RPTVAPAAATPSSAEVVRQKEALVRSLLGDSPLAARVNASQNADAKRFFATAQDHYNQAALHLQTGDTAKAEQFLNDAMWNIGRARQLVPDAASRLVEDKVRYARLLQGIDSLRASYARHLARANAKERSPGGASERDLERIDVLLDDAKTQMNAEKAQEAVRTLEQAEKALLVGINRLLGSTTLEYAEKFDTPAEEFAYEVERNRSLSDLVPLALAEIKPSEDARRLITRYVELNRTMREQALHEAGDKDHKAALKSIRTGTGYLQRALQAAGLVMPKEATSETSD
ncbi:MAG: hypothetical protein ACM3KD_05810, partial [Hyphomicrobiaceae bacterium]